MRVLKISYIGCGRIFKKHLNAYNENKNFFDIEAICDIDKKKITKHNLPKKIKSFKSIDDLLNNSNSDLYVILTPSGFHYSHIIKVGNQKKIFLLKNLW